MQLIAQSIRTLFKSPRYALLAIIIAGLGIGACTLVFGVFDALILRERAGIRNGATVVDIGRTDRGSGFDNFSYPDYVDYRTQNSTFTDIAAFDFSPTPAGLTVGEDTQNANAQWVSSNYFVVLGTRFAHGRSFASDDRPVAEIVLSHGYWQRRFQSNPAIVGRTVLFNNVPVAVVGVAEPGFAGSTVVAADFWVPFSFTYVVNPASERLNWRPGAMVMGAGRLKPGVTLAQAQADLGLIAARVAQQFPDSHRERGVAVQPGSRFPGSMRVAVTAFIGILGVLSLLAMLVAASNIAGLMLARAATRTREFAVRAALGADRRRLLKQVLGENMALFACGGIAGALFAVWGTSALVRLAPVLPVPLDLQLRVSPLALGFALVFSGLIGLLFSFGPAVAATKFDLFSVLRSAESAAGGGRKFGLRQIFLIVQLTFSLALLGTATTLTYSLLRLARQDAGFNSERVSFYRFDLRTTGMTDREGIDFLTQLLAEAQALANVESAALTSMIPLEGGGRSIGPLRLPEAAADAPPIQTDANIVTPGYFRLLELPLVQGRDFLESDANGAPLVGIVNETMARRLWPDQNPLGRILLNSNNQPIEVVGVARDSKYRTMGEEPRLHLYVPRAQVYSPQSALLLKSRTAVAPVAEVRALIRRLRSNLQLYEAQSLDGAIANSLVPQRIAAMAALGTGLLALLLAGMGVYGITLYWTSIRTREFGVRAALGATRGNLLLLALKSSVRLAAVAVLAGLAAAVGLSTLVNSLFGNIHINPLLLALTGTVFIGLVILAGFIPARRAARVDPMVALRAE